MDYRLDFFNSINEYVKGLTEDDAILVLSHNKVDGDCITVLAGDWEILSCLFAIKGYVNLNEGNQQQFINIKNMIINTAFNICATDNNYKETFLTALKNLHEEKPKKQCNYKNRYFVYETHDLDSKILKQGNNKQELKKYCKQINSSLLAKTAYLFDSINKEWVCI